jgi:hypothetical protein
MIEPKLTPEQKKLVDEYAEARLKVMAWKPEANPHAARFEELNSLILTWFENEKADEAILARGNRYTVPVAAREKKRTILRIPQLFKRLGSKWVAENVRPTLKAIEKALSPEEMKKFVLEERTGPRSLGEPVVHSATAKVA